MKRNLVLKKRIEIPIYDVRSWLVVAHDAMKERMRMTDVLGVYEGTEFGACCSYNGATFALFFYKRWLRGDMIAHEVFHLTHRILETSAVRFTPENHEPFTYLHGYLDNLVRVQLGKANLRILPATL